VSYGAEEEDKFKKNANEIAKEEKRN